jgi:hypothetical protein
MKLLVACEESQVVCKAFRERGHEAYSCDIQECSGGHPEWHINGDVLPLINGFMCFYTQDMKLHEIDSRWDILICHPPCTFMSKAGARFMYPSAGIVDEERLAKALEAKEFFLKLWNADCHRICIENPTPLKVVGLPPPSQIIEPYFFGDPYSKRTLLWEKNLPPLKPTNILRDYVPYMPSNTGGLARGMGGSRGVAHDAKTASKTFKGVGEAMAAQWGDPSTYEFNQQLSIFD